MNLGFIVEGSGKGPLLGRRNNAKGEEKQMQKKVRVLIMKKLNNEGKLMNIIKEKQALLE